MKQLYITTILIALLTTSCMDWLDVSPKAEIKSDVMLETEQGFKDALTGCYILMGDRKLYGQELSMAFLESLAQQYDYVSSGQTYIYSMVAQYQYGLQNIEYKINAVWLNMYNIIANVNNIIESLEVSKKNLSPTVYHMIKGEAYGLRAFLHFDLLRMFGYGNLKERPDMLDQPAIPYKFLYNKDFTRKSTHREVLQYIGDDLEIAINALYGYDPISKILERPADYMEDEGSLFFKNRSFRLNYNAVLATKMRLLLWEGDDNLPEIEEIGTYLTSTALIPWVSSVNINNDNVYDRDLSLSTEQLFGIDVYERYEKTIKTYFKVTLTTVFTTNNNAMFLSENRVSKLYEIPETFGESDLRYNRLLNRSDTKFEIIKYWDFSDNDGNAGLFAGIQPLIRTPEVYYMLAESKCKQGKLEDAIKLLNTVRNNRNITINYNLPSTLSTEEFYTELEKEWKKEFISEGQMFYYYKRLGYNAIEYSTKPMNDEVYKLPIPLAERND
ncbi:MAG: RagB/SusD family nutrient uptake outer membrane protein [Marinifilaceae bacterium]